MMLDSAADEGGEEWMRLLEGYDQASGEDTKEALEIAEDEDFENMEVSDEGDASALLAAVKHRLGASGRSAEYHDFLTAISKTRVDRQAALAIIKGHPDLIQAFSRCFRETDVGTSMAQESLDDPLGHAAGAAQLVQLVFTNTLKAGHEFEEMKMLEYVKRRSALSAFPRRLVILRGAAGTGKSEWAMNELRKEGAASAGLGQAETLAVRLTHVCSTDDFFMQFSGKSVADMKYVYSPLSIDANHIMNEARVRTAMEIGIDPLYVDNPNMKLWEMRPYVMLADRMGYVVTVVSPAEICAKWEDVDFLLSNRNPDKHVGRAALEAMCNSFEALPKGDPRPPIRSSERPLEDEGRFSLHASEYSTKLPPSAMLYKCEKLLKEGENLLRYTPPDGQGWGVNGELNGDWHAFREKGDGSCQYDDRLHWYTEDPEGGWTLGELERLAEMRQEAEKLAQAELPTAATHPSLFSKGKKLVEVAAKRRTAPSQPEAAAPATKQVSRAGAWESAPGGQGGSVPASRVERFKARMKIQREQEAREEVSEAAAAAPAAKKPRVGAVGRAEDTPSQSEEVSASAFLGAVKARLLEWGKVEQYHEFVLALSGTVDAKAAVRILRGHDDLLRVFRRKFAPEADLFAIKHELREEDAETPQTPSQPQLGRVKQELGAQPVKTAAQSGPRPPPGPPKNEPVKAVKAEVETEDLPKPPKLSMSAPPVTQTVDSDEEFTTEASIAAAVKKGADECIAQLAKLVFRREWGTLKGARPRLSMIRYAMKIASRPRFPRELFILRGPPGIGKTEYAMQQLSDVVSVTPDETLAARLTHVCAADDFFEEFLGDGTAYKFEASKLESYHHKNESRVRLAMEAGIHPLFVDCANLHLWEMRPYVVLAENLGYVVTVVEPGEICEKWDDVDFLVTAHDTTDRQSRGKVVQRGVLSAMVKAFQPIGVNDAVKVVKEAQTDAGTRLVEAEPIPPPKRPLPKADTGKGDQPNPGGWNTPRFSPGKGGYKGGGKKW